MLRKQNSIILLISFVICAVFFYKSFFNGLVLFPSDLQIAEYNPWKSYSIMGYNPGSYPNKAQYFDVLRQLYPWKSFFVSQIKELQLPLWNPYNFSGAPLLANFQSAVFYPLNILYTIFPLIGAWSILVFIQPLFALYFTYLYGRKIGMSMIAAVFAGVTYAFSHYMIVWIGYNTIGHIIAYLPLLLLAIEHLHEKKKTNWLVTFIFSCCAMILGGHIQIAFYCIGFSICYLVVKGYKKNHSSDWLFFISLYVLSFGLVAFQLIPGFELIANAARANHDYSFLTQKILIQPYQLIMQVVPDFFGNPATRNYGPQDTYIGKVMAVGIGAFLFAIYSFLNKRTYYILLFGVTYGIVLLLITKNPLTMLLYSFPIPFISSSAPTLLSFLAAFSLSILAGFGIDTWRNEKDSMKIRKAAGWLLSIFVVLWVVVILHLLPTGTNESVARKALLYQSFFAGLAILFFMAGSFVKKKLWIFFVLILLLQIGEQWRAFNKFNPFVPQEIVFPTTNIISHLQKKDDISRFWGYKAAAIEANFATYYSLFSPDGYDPLYPKRYGEFLLTSENGAIPTEFNTRTRSDAVISSNKTILENTSKSQVINMLGIRYILDRFENGSSEKDFPEYYKRSYEDNGWVVYENMKAAPRFFMTNYYQVFSSAHDFERKFFDKSFDVSRSIILEKEVGKLPNELHSKVDLIEYTPNKITFKTSSNGNALLFLSDTYYPGWVASVDTQNVELLRANYAFRAVMVPQGDHMVTMEYKPQSFLIGLWISIFSFMAIISFIVYLKRKKGIIEK